jgi:ribonucleoside-diphosphate reductase alpha chain
VDKFSHARFEPSGMTKNPEIRFAKSIVDYIFRWLATKFLSAEAQYRAGVNIEQPAESSEGVRSQVSGVRPGPSVRSEASVTVSPATDHSSPRRGAPSASANASADKSGAHEAKGSSFAPIQNQEDAPPCSTCGSIMIRSGSCYKCTNCGTTSGCA